VQDHEELENHAGFVHPYVPHQNKARQLLMGARRSNRASRLHGPSVAQHKPVGPRADLEPNHSHFLFVDAGPGAEGVFGHEIELRAAVEDAICAPRTRDDGPQTVRDDPAAALTPRTPSHCIQWHSSH
jgi:hypothetical protein